MFWYYLWNVFTLGALCAWKVTIRKAIQESK